jgi:hypothetical protein
MNVALCWDCNIIIYKFISTAKLWAEKVGRLCTTEDAQVLHQIFLCRDHFFPTDFVTPEGIRLNRLAVPCGLYSASHSIPQSCPPLLPTLSNPQPLAASPRNNLPVLPPEENSLIHQSQSNNTICQCNTQQPTIQPNIRNRGTDRFCRPDNHQKNHQPGNRHFPKTNYEQHVAL